MSGFRVNRSRVRASLVLGGMVLTVAIAAACRSASPRDGGAAPAAYPPSLGLARVGDEFRFAVPGDDESGVWTGTLGALADAGWRREAADGAALVARFRHPTQDVLLYTRVRSMARDGQYHAVDVRLRADRRQPDGSLRRITSADDDWTILQNTARAIQARVWRRGP
jgi:hypothetical protein